MMAHRPERTATESSLYGACFVTLRNHSFTPRKVEESETFHVIHLILRRHRLNLPRMTKGVGSILCGVFAFFMMVGGVFLAVVPVVGAVLSFGAVVVALAGIVLGGMGLSEAKQYGEGEGAALTGLVVSILSFLLSVVVALTCGLCNACMTASMGASGAAAGGIMGQAAQAAQAAQTAQQNVPQPSGTMPPLPSPPIPDEVQKRAIEELNAACPEHWCTDSLRYRFESLSCPASLPNADCILSFQATESGSPPQLDTIEISQSALILEEDMFPELLWEAVEEGLKAWEAQHSSP